MILEPGLAVTEAAERTLYRLPVRGWIAALMLAGIALLGLALS